MSEVKENSYYVQKALHFHKNGYNCAQAVACAFCDEFGVDQETMFRIAEGFGFGMGMQEVCGALSGLYMILGLDNSIGDPEKGKITKTDTYKKVKAYSEKFKEKNGSIYCRELKSKADGKQIVSCDQCIADATAFAEEYLITKKVQEVVSQVLGNPELK